MICGKQAYGPWTSSRDNDRDECSGLYHDHCEGTRSYEITAWKG